MNRRAEMLMGFTNRLVAGLLGGFVAVAASGVMADEAMSLSAVATGTTYFSADEVTFELSLSSERATEGRITWQLASLHRTIARGDALVKLDPDQPDTIKFRLRMPPIKPGVVQQTTLTADFHQAGDEDPSATFQRDLWVFSSDPFVDRSEWLEQLELRLFDPSGDTAKIFKDAKIPFADIRTAAELEAIESGIVIVAEGVKHSQVAETLWSMAADGHRILWLAPAEIEFELPGSDGFAGKRPKEIVLAGSERVKQLDKRLDPSVWTDTDRVHSVGLKIVAGRSRTNVEIGPPDEGWVWLQAEYSDPDGILILCGLGLVDAWPATPTPRFLLARLLEQLDNTDHSTEVTEQ